VSAVVEAMPQLTESSAASTPRRNSSSRKQNAHQPHQATRRYITGTTPRTETEDSSDKEDAGEDFGKLYNSVSHVSVAHRVVNNFQKKIHITRKPMLVPYCLELWPVSTKHRASIIR